MGGDSNFFDKLCFWRKRKTSSQEQRTLYVNNKIPDEIDQPTKLPKYADNRIKTSKYKIYTFPFKNLFEQFRRIGNTYFLCVAIISFSIDSPVTPWTSTLPLLFVIGVTAIKQGYEDWRRHVEDNKVNNVPARVLREGKMTEVRTRDILVGDVVEVSIEEQFPCDLLLLLSSDPETKCDVTTANLDGETNLKTFFCPEGTHHLQTPEDLWHFRAVINCELPHANLYDFKGRLDVYRGNSEPTKSSLSTENLLLRGARLKNTDKIYGVAVYTGEETKMALNTKMTRNKFSTVEIKMNYYLIFYLIVLLTEVTVCTILKYELYSLTKEDNMWYMENKNFNGEGASFEGVSQDFFSFLVIFNYIIPISLYVTLEVQKFFGIIFFNWDDDIQCPQTGERAKANTSDLNEELGQVQYLFTDKTGTLTENIMNFRHCSVAGKKYVNVDGQIRVLNEYSTRSEPLPTLPVELEIFLETLALCHTVRVTANSSKAKDDFTHKVEDGEVLMKFQYQASSPDEKALVEACAAFGVIFEQQIGNQLTLDFRGQKRTFTRLQVLEFDSDRKRMSVVIKDNASGSIWLLTKGAESSVFKKCKFLNDYHRQVYELTNNHINDYAMIGLRTLAVARRELTPELYEQFSQDLNKARQKLDGREEAVTEVMNRMEDGLTLLGATGVEDLLQDGVQETLESLRVAGIKVWVLTGDKVETAVNIAYSCGHFKKFMTVLGLTGIQDSEGASECLARCDEESKDDGHYGLVVDGASLQILLEHLQEKFYEVCSRCTAVVCCRMSPKQKAETVRLVKKSSENPVCAAIGDGANDVSMIQEAHIGFGIMGKEGRQAVRCSDFSFARFRFLKKVLLVHGHWYYVRVSTLVQYSFYKNLTFITPQVFFAFWNAFSTQTVYDSLVLTMYNITFTALPVLVYGLFDQNIPSDLLMSRPHLYKANAKNASMSWSTFFMWIGFGLWHSGVMYFGLMFFYLTDQPSLPFGQTIDLYLFGTTLCNICVYVVNIKLVLVARYYTQFFIWSVILTLVFYVALCLLYEGIMIDVLENYEIFWSFYRMYESAWLQFASIFLAVVCLVPDVIHVVFQSLSDERVLEKRRERKRQRNINLVPVKGYFNESFDPSEGDGNVWTITRNESWRENAMGPSSRKRSLEKDSQDRQTISTGRVSIKSTGSLKSDIGGQSPSESGSWQGTSVVI
ncbi:LOW QUALITY PROTEIN: phospholipid-transporting ATPase IF-like [Palaemon carinicauda]|uniref:LOW QUALITY PROTEIN: phospholipid-transporting ATPase IF-like n=1 Tax=Palaemon carinicauda TaxID=392227 RepID=UPI0035B65A5D